MGTTVITSNTDGQFSFSATGQALEVVAGVNYYESASFVVYSAFGEDTIDAEGTISGTMGIFDFSSVGQDTFEIGAAGSIIGVTGDGIDVIDGGNSVINLGVVDGGGGAGVALGAGNLINNQGRIVGAFEGIWDGGFDRIDNVGSISSLALTGEAILETAGGDLIVNTGTITTPFGAAAVKIAGGVNTITNSGSIVGGAFGLDLEDGGDVVTNKGEIAGDEALYIGGVLGSSQILNSGSIIATGGVLTAAFVEGSQSLLDNSGTIRGSVAFEDDFVTLVNTGALYGNVEFFSGDSIVRNKGEIEGSISFSGNNNTYSGAYGSVDGIVSISGSNGLYVGGAQGTTFEVQTSQLATTDTIIGGASANDTLILTGAGTVALVALKHVSGFETIELESGGITFTLTEALADSAAGHSITIEDVAGGGDVINLAKVVSTTDKVRVLGANGHDVIVAGASLDTFEFDAASDSTGAAYDTIFAANFGRDKFDIPGGAGSVKAIQAAVTTGTLSTATFDANLAADLGPTKLGANDAVLFTASAGTLKGDTFLVVDMNATAGYQAGQDLVVRLAGATGTLTTGSFI